MRWNDFVQVSTFRQLHEHANDDQAMNRIGFGCRTSGKHAGSGRTFTTHTEEGKLSMRIDQVGIHIASCI